MSTEPRSHLHENALTRADLAPGKVIVRFNIHHGNQGTFTVVDDPFEHEGRVKVELEKAESGERVSYYLTDLGVAPSEGGFNSVNFVVALSDQHLLPTELVPCELDQGPNQRSRLPFDDLHWW